MVSMWENEPDIDELRRVYALLSTDASQALAGLRALSERGSVMSMVYLATAYKETGRVPRSIWLKRRNGIGVLPSQGPYTPHINSD
jgi:hypothetical protein